MNALIRQDPIDRVVTAIDRGLRALTGVHRAARPSPANGVPDAAIEPRERSVAAALMRVNHAGEVCAQALYEAQALAATDGAVRASLEASAREEEDHLSWSRDRIRELGGRTSLLNPLWYGGSFAIGLAAGIFGDRWNLAFLAETERQVEAHLDRHLASLPMADGRTRSIVEVMRADEARHRIAAESLGAAALPRPAVAAMRIASRVMTTLSHRL